MSQGPRSKGPRPRSDWRTDVFARAVDAGALDEAWHDWRRERNAAFAPTTYEEFQARWTKTVAEFAREVVGRDLLSIKQATGWVERTLRSRTVWERGAVPLDFRLKWSDR